MIGAQIENQFPHGTILTVLYDMKELVHIGTSGWSYREWRKEFYPVSVKPADYLAYYAQHFNTTEINSSYYHLPKETIVKRWGDTVNQAFRFCPKINKEVTHLNRLKNPEQTLPEFFEVFGTIKKQLGPVLIQLPPSLSFEKETVSTFYNALAHYKGFHFAIEPRHDSWFSSESINLMKTADISFVIADWGGSRTYAEFVTASAVYIRLHGSARYDTSYSDDFLNAYAKRIKHWTLQGHAVWVFFNNTAKGHAIDNAKKLTALIQ